jgi:hypothetical protein
MLKRDDLERDLVGRDKQSLISDCLRLFDSNLRLKEIIDQQDHKIDIARKEAERYRQAFEKQKTKTWVQVLNQTIEEKLKKLKRKNLLTHEAEDTNRTK